MFPPRICLLLMPLVALSCRNEPKVPGADLQVVAERVAVSKAKTPAGIMPYNEALAWHEYTVKRVIEGQLDAEKIRVAHWTVMAGQAVPLSDKLGERVTMSLRTFNAVPGLREVAASDDLDFTEDAPRYLDFAVLPGVAKTPEALRFDYAGHFSGQMILYWKLRAQTRLVVMGNSRATKGVNARGFFQPDNERIPTALNLAPAGASSGLQCLLVREYVLPLPKLEWVVWEVSVRNFNARRREGRPLSLFQSSPGWQHDEKNKASRWPAPVPPKPIVMAELPSFLGRYFDWYGWEGGTRESESQADGSDLLEAMSDVDFSWDDSIWEEQARTVRELQAKRIKVLLFTAPIHPLVKEAKAADPDDTSRKGLAEMVRHLEALDGELSLVWFRDFNKGGNHEFPADEFADAGHVNGKGAERLTRRIIEWMDSCHAP